MASSREIKNHIRGVKDMRKITNAMYLIASTKMRRAKAALDKTRPYFTALKAEIKRIFRTARNIENKYFYPADGSSISSGDYACLVITADKGLAGSYNMNVIKQTKKMLKEHKNTKLFVVGEYGRRYFYRHGIPIERSFLYTAQNPTMHRAREISSILLDLYDSGEVKKIFVIYTDLENSLSAEAVSARLLPFHRAQFVSSKTEKAVPRQFEFSPSVADVLDNIMLSYISGFIYSALVGSFCSEQNARMTAMSAANQNADNLLSELTTKYNRVRQSAITQEINEVIAGAKVLKEKK